MKYIISEQQIRTFVETHLHDVNWNFPPYPTEDEFKKKEPRRYLRDLKLGLIDLYYPNRTKDDEISQIKEKLAKYKTSGEVQKYDPELYLKAINKNILRLVFPEKHLRSPETEQKYIDNLIQSAQKYKSASEVLNNDKNLYQNLQRKGILYTLFPKKTISDDELVNKAKEYGTRSNLIKQNKKLYMDLWKRDIVSLAFPKTKEEALLNKAREYKTKHELLTKNKNLYQLLWIAKLLDTAFPKKNLTEIAEEILKKNDIPNGSWVRTKTEEFQVIDTDNNQIIGRSFCDPDKIVKINPEDIVDVKSSDHNKMVELKNLEKLNFQKFYQIAGLTEQRRTFNGNQTILFLDDSRNPFTSKEDWIGKYSNIGGENANVKHVQTLSEFIKFIETSGMPAEIIFDNDLGKKDKEGGSGCLAAAWLVKHCMTNHLKLPKWSIVSANKYGRCCIGSVLRKFESLT